jgi:hypothetical protein
MTQLVGRRPAACLALAVLVATAGCARRTAAVAEQDTLRRLPPDALLYAELDVRGLLAAVPAQRELLTALVPNACVALVDATWSASFAVWEGASNELAIGLTGPALDTVETCLQRGLSLVRRPPPAEAAPLAAVALYGEAREAWRRATAPTWEPTPEEIEALVVDPSALPPAPPEPPRDEEPAGMLLLSLGPRTHLLVSPSLVPRMAALQAGAPTLAAAPLLELFGRLPEGQLVGAASLPLGLRGSLARAVREAGLAQEVPEPAAAGLSLVVQQSRLELRVRLEAVDGAQAALLRNALEALRRSARKLVDGLAGLPTSPAGLATATRLLDGVQLALDGNAVTAAATVDDALASLAMLAVAGAQTWLAYMDVAHEASTERREAEHDARAADAARVAEQARYDALARALEEARGEQRTLADALATAEEQAADGRALAERLGGLRARGEAAAGDPAALEALRLELLRLTDTLTSPSEDPAPPSSDSPLAF